MNLLYFHCASFFELETRRLSHCYRVHVLLRFPFFTHTHTHLTLFLLHTPHSHQVTPWKLRLSNSGKGQGYSAKRRNRDSGWREKLTTHVHLVLMLRMSGAVTLGPLYAFATCIGSPSLPILQSPPLLPLRHFRRYQSVLSAIIIAFLTLQPSLSNSFPPSVLL